MQELKEPLIKEDCLSPSDQATTEKQDNHQDHSTEPKLNVKAIAKMSLREFERVGLLLKIDSNVLGEIVYFASDDRAILRDLPEGTTCYTTKELQTLIDQNVKPGKLKFIHDTKKIFNNPTITGGPKPLLSRGKQ